MSSQFMDRKIKYRCGIHKAFYDRESSVIFVHGPAGSGKTFAMISKAYHYGEQYEGAQIFFARQTRVSLTDSVLRTFEKDVLPHGHPMKPGPRDAKAENRKIYYNENGSLFKCIGIENNGLDDGDVAGHFKSTQYNFGFIEEVTESSMAEVETIITRMRADGTPYNQLVCCFNPPGDPDHWVWSFKGRPGVTFYETVLEDNPLYFEYDAEGKETHPLNQRKGNWTEKGQRYLKMLDITSGDIRDRYKNGRASMDTKRVHPEFDPQLHVPNTAFLHWLRDLPLTPTEKEVFIEESFDVGVSIDWGIAHPTVVGLFLDPKSSSFEWFDGYKAKHRLVAQLYRSHTVSDEIGKEFLNYCGWDNVKAPDGTISFVRIENELGFAIPIIKDGGQAVTVITDHDLQARELFEREVGLTCTPAFKSIDVGIPEVSRCLRMNDVLFDKLLIGGEDYWQARKHAPTCIQQEFSRYKWKLDTKGQGKTPNRVHDDACTMLRYYIGMAYNLSDKMPVPKNVHMENYTPHMEYKPAQISIAQNILGQGSRATSLLSQYGGNLV